jgi:hypothetical protein
MDRETILATIRANRERWAERHRIMAALHADLVAGSWLALNHSRELLAKSAKQVASVQDRD